jgi:GT2 family glycosyltransferase
MTISIIIPTHNSERTIRECLDSLMQVEAQNHEILILDDSTDRTAELIREYKNVNVITCSKPAGAKRNDGAALSKGDILVFIDDDVIVTRDWLPNLIKDLDGSIAEVGGPNLTPPDDTFLAKCAGYVLSSPLGSGGIRYGNAWREKAFVNHNPSCNIAVRKSAYQEIGGFREDFWPSEDVEFDNRLLAAGYKIVYEPEAVVYHRRKDTVKKFFWQIFNYGKNRVLLRKMDKGMVSTIHYMPSLVAVTFVLLLVLGVVHRIFWFLLLGLGMVYLTICGLYAISEGAEAWIFAHDSGIYRCEPYCVGGWVFVWDL